ncbi:MAG: hypothetical protein O2923_05080 [Verrucomicrobia bacterium]|nr:hypothetical protein [Verrucomicrobiota bacterium]MDA1087087.1 hypothetical protein [Verrucomicrobiota bacterium]
MNAEDRTTFEQHGFLNMGKVLDEDEVAHFPEHPLRMDYMQLIVLLSDCSETTHCFSLSPESVHDPILKENEE